MDYKTLFDLFANKHANINDTSFYFSDDPLKTMHFIGYVPQDDAPYWVGACDIEGGCDYKTAKELFEAPIFDGRSIKDRWDKILLLQIGGIAMKEWKPEYCPSQE